MIEEGNGKVRGLRDWSVRDAFFLPFLIAVFLFPSCLSAQSKFTDQWAGRPLLSPLDIEGAVRSRMKNAPRVGEKAPEAVFVDAETGKGVLLRQLCEEKPVVLFFGSYSCLPVRDSAGEMKELQERFGDSVDFCYVQIREAHPTNGVPPPVLSGQAFVVDPPKSLEERSGLARKLCRECDIPFRILLDPIEDMNAVRWAAWPVRIFVVNPEGTVQYAGQQGPWFYKPMKGTKIELVGVPEEFGEIPGYSRESLEEFLEREYPE
ncbi:MAG: hypothetical protein MI807_10435 [Verrucomicrobiales bacterium]|nr:hypothetical protein [Verrucomicrobiales bacterium]